jgi:uncharacterized protein (TIGR03435 family)
VFQQPIKGSPSWVDSDRYTIDVKAEDAAISQETMRGPMMQALLEERFKLKIHRESKEIPVYELTVVSGGAKLQPSKEGSCIVKFSPQDREPAPGQPLPRVCGMFNPNKGGGTDVPGTTIGSLCRQFSVTLDRDVIDKTGLQGMFDIHLPHSRLRMWSRLQQIRRNRGRPARPRGRGARRNTWFSFGMRFRSWA